ncbi:MAG: inorganic phosphate transporter [Chloroflexi bacterium]|nr:inorganic phosphate transporter [Chloroflexota bacterium]MBI3930535.1 inorganic phosphate transporter [Chloroflexota bacterium]
MPEASLILLLLIIALALGFGVTNGFNDAANAVATVIGTRVLSPRNAIILAAALNFAGAATGLEVAKTIGKGILAPETLTYLTVIAGLASAVIWVSLATYYGLPLSVTHSLIAGLAGAGMAVAGSDAIVWNVMTRVVTSVVAAPVLGFVAGFVLMVWLFWLFRRSAPARVQAIFGKLQIFSAAFMAYSHGKNDGQMPIGVIAIALIIYYQGIGQSGQAAAVWDEIASGNLWWVVVISSLAISLGTAFGGWRVIRTLGLRVTTLRPVHGFAAETAGAAIIESASLLGIPVSTTHCITAAIMGVGATRRLSAVRWGVAGNIVTAWIITFPICGALGYLFAWLLKLIF